jgi:tetratricopeptide (TPR) repeat protein
VREYFIAPLIVTALAFASQTTAAWVNSDSSQCGADPNPTFSIESLIASCTRTVRGAPEYMGSGFGMMTSVPPDARAQAYYWRGLYHHFDHQYDLAIADYSSAIGIRRAFGDAYAARADAYEDAGDHVRAAADYAQAATLQDDNANDLTKRCWVRAIRGHPLDRAMADCDASLKLNPEESVTFVSRCVVNYRLGNYANAISDCSQALKQQRQSPGILYVRGLAKTRSGDAAGGNADIAAATDAYRQIDEVYAFWGVKP